jgi:hypothetical protein
MIPYSTFLTQMRAKMNRYGTLVVALTTQLDFCHNCQKKNENSH